MRRSLVLCWFVCGLACQFASVDPTHILWAQSPGSAPPGVGKPAEETELPGVSDADTDVLDATSDTASSEPPPDAPPNQLSGFEWFGQLTAAQLASAAQIHIARPSKEATNAASKLLWNLRRLPRGTVDEKCESWGLRSLQELPVSPSQPKMLDMQGRAVKIDAVRVPAEMSELLEVDRIYRTTVRVGPDEMQVVSLEAPQVWASRANLDEPVTFCGLCVRLESEASDNDANSEEAQVRNPTVVAFASRLRWYPESGWPTGWLMLSNYGFDLSQFANTIDRMREPLSSDDRDSFYGMLSIASQLSQSPKALEEAEATETIALLREPRKLAGRWIQVKLTTARISRIVLQDPELIEKLGQKDYWQVDCFGDLSDVRVVLENGDDEEDSLVFENRFPVSVAVTSLPDWLAQRVNQGVGGSGRIDARMISEPVLFTGFAYRLWSYESDYTESRGGRQVAPLLVASNLLEDSAEVSEGGGAEIFGWLLAGFVVSAVLITSLVVWRTDRRDRMIKQQGRGLSS